jgi:ribosome-associated toxin RatA of RatAB toxin-antitoxin module
MPLLNNQKILAHSIEKVFSLALALDEYPKILPYVKSVRIHKKSDEHLTASLLLGFSFIHFTHECDIRFKAHTMIEVTSTNRLFKRFKSRCELEAIAPNCTKISYTLDAVFYNPVFEWVAKALLPVQAEVTMRAFENYLNRA